MFPQDEPSERVLRCKLEAAVSSNLSWEVIHHHFCRILLVVESSPSTVWEATSHACECRRQGSLGAILEDGYSGRVWGDSLGSQLGQKRNKKGMCFNNV